MSRAFAALTVSLRGSFCASKRLLFGREKYQSIIGDVACSDEGIFLCFAQFFKDSFYSGSVSVYSHKCGVLQDLYTGVRIMLLYGGRQISPGLLPQRNPISPDFLHLRFTSLLRTVDLYFAIVFCCLGVTFNGFFS